MIVLLGSLSGAIVLGYCLWHIHPRVAQDQASEQKLNQFELMLDQKQAQIDEAQALINEGRELIKLYRPK